MADNKELKASTEANRKKKAERREAKAARKEANKEEQKKSRPNNIVLALMIFGVIFIMFAVAGGYNYFSKPATIEKYVTDNGIDQMYNNVMIDEHTSMKLKAEKNTVKIWLSLDEDAHDHELEEYGGEEGIKTLKNIGSYFLTSLKPQTRALSGKVKIKAKQGEETLNYVEMSYSEAKKFIKELEKEASEDIDTDEDAGEDAEAEEEAETESDGE